MITELRVCYKLIELWAVDKGIKRAMADEIKMGI